MPDEPTTSTTDAPDAVLTGLQRLIERQAGDASRVAELLYRENYDLRERNRQLAVPEGAVVLPSEHAAAWQAYQALGTPETLAEQLAQATKATATLAELQRAAHLRTIAEAAGYRPGVLQRLAADVTLELREGAAFVVSGETVTPLADYAAREWADFLPALQAPEPGTAFVRQGTGGGTPPTDPVAAFIAARNEARDKAPVPLKRS
ncbi:MAG: hypothetical protein EOM10_14750 [Opitutae bacterium]|nr:hypothetical protein [Opitutae bacterium]